MSIILLASCANQKIISSSFTTTFDLFKDYFKDEDLISKELVSQIPYASAALSFGDNKESLVILESLNQDNFVWVSADRKVFFMKDGRINRTIGMPSNLYYVERPVINFKQIIDKGAISYISYYSFRQTTLNNLTVNIKAKVVGLRNINILGDEKRLLLIEEEIYGKVIGWEHTNKYWIDPDTYFVWASEQSINPKLPPVSFKITKKPAM